MVEGTKKLFNTVEDVESFIIKKEWHFPSLLNLLSLRSKKELDLTDTESDFYFNSWFDYIFSVYTEDNEKTLIALHKWLSYMENTLVHQGLSGIKSEAYEHVHILHSSSAAFDKFRKELNIPDELPINYYTNIETDTPDYYKSRDKKCIEEFWIKTDRYSIQPIELNGEAYARVHVYPKRVYIYGCDDSSYTLKGNEEEIIDFVKRLKFSAPVWNFYFHRRIHHKLEFTN